jgi:hypothetical protein
MAAARYLEYEVALLLAKYGRSAVLETLALKLELTPEQLEAMLQRPIDNKRTPRPKKKPPGTDLAAQLEKDYPAKAECLRTLYSRFENRTFLPELRDVKRFFEMHDRPVGALRSRAETLPKVLRLLADLEASDLEALCQARPEGTYSSLGVISDEILRRDR